MTIAQKKEKFIHFIVLALIAVFFTILINGLCTFDCKFNSPKRIASVLLLLIN